MRRPQLDHSPIVLCAFCGAYMRQSHARTFGRPDQFGQEYICRSCATEDDRMEDTPQDEGISDADPGL